MERARATCLEILSQRDYTISDQDDDRIIAIKPDGNEMVVFFSDVPKFNVKNIQSYITSMDEMSIFHTIIVYKDGVTAFTRKAIEQSLEMTFELFSVDDLQYNITKHRLQPRFERLSEEEATKFKETYGVQFGTMKRDDPISNFYAYQRGDVIKVTRANGYVNYRIVKG
jgi:DNA-directed RNA polymerase I, II, and III subunit RPABC1